MLGVLRYLFFLHINRVGDIIQIFVTRYDAIKTKNRSTHLLIIANLYNAKVSKMLFARFFLINMSSFFADHCAALRGIFAAVHCPHFSSAPPLTCVNEPEKRIKSSCITINVILAIFFEFFSPAGSS